MKTTTLSPKMRRQRKVLLVLPLIVLPVLTLLFWALGGGKISMANGQVSEMKGLNTNLPDAKVKDDQELNKMNYYDRAASDSLKLKQQMKTDPYYRSYADQDRSGNHFLNHNLSDRWNYVDHGALSGQNADGRQAAGADQVYEKLAQLQTAINKPARPIKIRMEPSLPGGAIQDTSPDTARGRNEDPELKQMNGLLEKILDIQHPERLKEKTGGQVSEPASDRFKAIPAVIDGKQKITQGTVVRLRLLDTVTIKGQLVPKGQLLYGRGELYNQRLIMTIKLIRMGTTILPANLTVFDMTDGLEGICVPEAITEDAVKNGAASSVQGLELMSLDPSVGTQLAGAGINAAKGLFSKKVKRIKAKLKDGHPLLLRDNEKLRRIR
jgi:hypothetical protein